MLSFSCSSSSDAPTTSPAEIRIRSLAPGEDSTAFRTLNEEWITRHFTLEAKDRETLGDPQRSILSKGGPRVPGRPWRPDGRVCCSDSHGRWGV